jgi:general secretion pathway protein A
MYQQYFGLSEAPFSIAPDPRYLYLSDKHREALAHLIYGVGDQGGFVLLTGEVGTGKTTICRCLLQQVPANADIAFIINPRQSINQLLQSVFIDLHISFDKGATSKELIDRLNEYLLEAHALGRNTILIIDEAQNLSVDVLEQLRLLTNLETNEKKLLQLVLLGQPELNNILSRQDMRQLAQRVTARYHLSPLSKEEITDYIKHRLAIADCRNELFPPAAIRKIYQLSNGVPRLINLICDRSLLGVYSSNEECATAAIVSKAAQEVFPQPVTSKWGSVWIVLAALVIIAVVAIAFNVFSPSATIKAQPSVKQVVPITEIKPEVMALDMPTALKRLMALWKLTSESVTVDCKQFSRQWSAIYCIQGATDWQQLLANNSPALLLLTDQSGQQLKGFLQANQNQYLLTIDGDQRQFSKSQLASYRVDDSLQLSRIPANLSLPIDESLNQQQQYWLFQLLGIEAVSLTHSSTAKAALLAIDNTIPSSKTAILYAHHLIYQPAVMTSEHSSLLSELVKEQQARLNMPQDGVVTITLLQRLTADKYQQDPVFQLPTAIQSEG